MRRRVQTEEKRERAVGPAVATARPPASPHLGSRPDATTNDSRAPHRILVVSADMGGGHNATAVALEEAVQRRWPGSRMQRVDALQRLGPGFGPWFRSIYVTNVEHTPWLYEFFYASLWRHRWFANASKRFTGAWCGRSLAPVIDRYEPDVIISTYPIGSSGLAWLRRHRGLPVPTGAWISDFAPHPFWVYRDVDVNLVMHEAAVPNARAAAPGSRVAVSRLPVDEGFLPAADEAARSAARARAGLRGDAFCVLVSCGSYAFGHITETVGRLLAAGPRVQVVAVCGHNQTVRRHLDRLGEDPDRLSVRGWERDMPSLVTSADLVVTNAGGATALEAIASGTPVLMYAPIAAHGQANADLMTVAGLAELCVDPEQLTARVRTLACDPEAVRALRQRALRHARRTDLDDGLRRLAASGVHSRTERAWPMRGEDAFFAHVENEAVRQEPGLVCRVEPDATGAPLTVEAVRTRMAALADELPALRRIPVRAPRPGWRVQPALDPARHVVGRLLPEGSADHDGGRTAALAAVRELWNEPSPAGIPPWRIVVVSGLADGTTWLGLKIHHSALDGMSGLGLMDRLLEPIEAPPGRSVSRHPAPTPRSPADRLRTAVHAIVGTASGIAGLAAAGPAPRHPINREIADRRRNIVTWETPDRALGRVAHALHAGKHELALCLVADALRRTLVPAGLLRADRPLRMMVPVTVRSVRLDRSTGNWSGSLPIDVPLQEMPFSERLAVLRARMRRQSARGQARGAHAVMWTAGRLPSRWHRFVAQRVYGGTFFNVLASFLPGPRSPRALAGHRLTGLFPVLPLAPGVPVTAGVITYAGKAGIGVTLDAGLGVSAVRVRRALNAAWVDAEAAAGSARDR